MLHKSAACGAAGRIARDRFRRGVFLLPSLFTVANLFCGYACVVYSTRRLRHSRAVHRHRDGARHARRVLRAPDELIVRVWCGARFARRRRLVRPRAGDPGVHVGTVAAGAARMGGGLPLRHRGRDAARAVQRPEQSTTASTDKRYFVGMPSPAAAAVIASTVYLYPYGLQDARNRAARARDGPRARRSSWSARSVSAASRSWMSAGSRSYLSLFLGAVAIALIALHPQIALVVLHTATPLAALIVWGYDAAATTPRRQSRATVALRT